MVCLPQDPHLGCHFISVQLRVSWVFFKLPACPGELKEAIRTGENLDQFRLQNREAQMKLNQSDCTVMYVQYRTVIIQCTIDADVFP